MGGILAIILIMGVLIWQGFKYDLAAWKANRTDISYEEWEEEQLQKKLHGKTTPNKVAMILGDILCAPFFAFADWRRRRRNRIEPMPPEYRDLPVKQCPKCLYWAQRNDYDEKLCWFCYTPMQVTEAKYTGVYRESGEWAVDIEKLPGESALFDQQATLARMCRTAPHWPPDAKRPFTVACPTCKEKTLSNVPVCPRCGQKLILYRWMI